MQPAAARAIAIFRGRVQITWKGRGRNVGCQTFLWVRSRLVAHDEFISRKFHVESCFLIHID